MQRGDYYNLNDMFADVTAVKGRCNMLQHITAYSQAVIGDFRYSARSNDHLGWMVCDGRALDTTEYAALYEVIGFSFGGSNSQFKLPDCRGRVLGAIGTGSGLTARTLGTTVGEEAHTLTIPEIPSHSHSNNTVAGTLGLMSANNSNTATVSDTTVGEPNIYALPAALTISATGGGAAHNNMQPTLFGANMFIFTGVH